MCDYIRVVCIKRDYGRLDITEVHRIKHRLTKLKHPLTNGQIARLNRTIKEATVKRFHYGNHTQLRTHLHDFMATYNFGRRFKTLSAPLLTNISAKYGFRT
jgi:hypothetical protein